MLLNKKALHEACKEVVKNTLWQTPEPVDINDIIDTNQIEQTVKSYFEIAMSHVESVKEAGRNPNLITRAVRHLAQAHAIPPMKDDIEWFKERLETLIELACPNCIHTKKSIEFFKDIEQCIKDSRNDING